MDKKKILFLVNHEIVIYNFRKELVDELINQGYEVFISCPYGSKLEYFKSIGCKCIDIKINRHGINPIEDLKLIRRYRHLIKKIKPNAIFTYTIKPNIYGSIAAKGLGIPVITNITGLGSAVENKSLLQKITILMYKFAFSNIKTVFFQNKENMNFFEKNKIAIGKHKLLPGSGVNLKYFLPLKYPKNDTVEFVFISRIMKEKGIDQYLKAAEYIKQKYPETKFHICGFCEERYENILQNYQEKGIISYHGMIADVRTVLQRVHCTIHPTYYPEGLSNVLLESCACERPIITTDRSGCREVVDDGKNGFLIKERDTEDLIKKIEKFLSLSSAQRLEMAKYARLKVENEFDREIVVKRYIKEIN